MPSWQAQVVGNREFLHICLALEFGLSWGQNWSVEQEPS
jgi:hypothetical protein